MTGFRGIAGLDHKALGMQRNADDIHRYCERTGRAGIEHWNLYLAYNLFRIVAIQRGVYKQATDRLASAAEGSAQRARVTKLAELGARYAGIA